MTVYAVYRPENGEIVGEVSSETGTGIVVPGNLKTVEVSASPSIRPRTRSILGNTASSKLG